MPSLARGKSIPHTVNQGKACLTKYSIPIHERVELPEDLIPADSRVEIDAKITAGKLVPLVVYRIREDS